MQSVRVLVVDNSIFFRDELADGLARELPNGSLVERAAAPVEAKDKVRLFKPNVAVVNYSMAAVTLDGKRFFAVLADLVDGPVVAFGALAGGKESALQAGAIDYIVKPTDGDVDRAFFKTFVSRVQLAITRYNLLPTAKKKKQESTPAIKPGSIMTRAGWRSARPAAAAETSASSPSVSSANAALAMAMRAKTEVSAAIPGVQRTAAVSAPPAVALSELPRATKKIELIAIGSSTGGTEALSVVLKALRPPLPPIVIVQHIPALFSRLLSERLNEECVIHVKEAADGDTVMVNTAYIAPGGKHMTIARSGGIMALTCKPGPRVHSCCPSVDVLFDSVVQNIGGPTVLGIILTGMGQDGAAGLLKMRQKGSPTLGQDEATCVVYGMPRAAFEMGAVEKQLPLTAIAPAIMKIAGS